MLSLPSLPPWAGARPGRRERVGWSSCSVRWQGVARFLLRTDAAHRREARHALQRARDLRPSAGAIEVRHKTGIIRNVFLFCS